MKYLIPVLFLLSLILTNCKSTTNDTSQATHPPAGQTRFHSALLTYADHEAILSSLASVQQFKKLRARTLQQSPPVIRLKEGDVRQDWFFAQAVALNNKEFVQQCFLPKTKEPLLNMMTEIRRPTAKEVRLNQLSGDLILVEMYNFYYNTVVHGWVDIHTKKIIKVVGSPGKLPNITKEMEDLAKEIAMAYPQVKKELDVGQEWPKDMEIVVRNSKSERYRHFYAAVTMTPKDSQHTLWVLVDLTELKAVGYQWTSLWNPKRPQLVTERSLQNEVVFENYCKDTVQLNQGKWVVNYKLTNSDGIEIFDVKYNGKPVLNSAKLVDWHVSYPDKKDFGYSDAMGCPKFSSAAVVAFEPPDIQPIMKGGVRIGFSFVQDFRSPVWPKSCNYRYQNRYEFYADGRFRIAGVNLGLGCSNNGWYRPVFRIDMADEGGQQVEVWQNKHWEKWTQEKWHLQEKKARFSPQGYLVRLTNPDGSGYYLEPSRGQFGDGGRGDHAYTYVTVKHPDLDEGVSDMSTVGPCCNTNFEQGPEKYLQPAEPLDGHQVIWYVPQMKNSDQPGKQYCWVENRVVDGHEGFVTYNGVVGPMLVPFASAK